MLTCDVGMHIVKMDTPLGIIATIRPTGFTRAQDERIYLKRGDHVLVLGRRRGLSIDAELLNQVELCVLARGHLGWLYADELEPIH
jgi:hypothetical protein